MFFPIAPRFLEYETDLLQNDRIFISHRHDPEDGFPNLEDMGEGYNSDDQDSQSSVVYRTVSKTESRPRGNRIMDRWVHRYLPSSCTIEELTSCR